MAINPVRNHLLVLDSSNADKNSVKFEKANLKKIEIGVLYKFGHLIRRVFHHIFCKKVSINPQLDKVTSVMLEGVKDLEDFTREDQQLTYRAFLILGRMIQKNRAQYGEEVHETAEKIRELLSVKKLNEGSEEGQIDNLLDDQASTSSSSQIEEDSTNIDRIPKKSAIFPSEIKTEKSVPPANNAQPTFLLNKNKNSTYTKTPIQTGSTEEETQKEITSKKFFNKPLPPTPKRRTSQSNPFKRNLRSTLTTADQAQNTGINPSQKKDVKIGTSGLSQNTLRALPKELEDFLQDKGTKPSFEELLGFARIIVDHPDEEMRNKLVAITGKIERQSPIILGQKLLTNVDLFVKLFPYLVSSTQSVLLGKALIEGLNKQNRFDELFKVAAIGNPYYDTQEDATRDVWKSAAEAYVKSKTNDNDGLIDFNNFIKTELIRIPARYTTAIAEIIAKKLHNDNLYTDLFQFYFSNEGSFENQKEFLKYCPHEFFAEAEHIPSFQEDEGGKSPWKRFIDALIGLADDQAIQVNNILSSIEEALPRNRKSYFDNLPPKLLNLLLNEPSEQSNEPFEESSEITTQETNQELEEKNPQDRLVRILKNEEWEKNSNWLEKYFEDISSDEEKINQFINSLTQIDQSFDQPSYIQDLLVCIEKTPNCWRLFEELFDCILFEQKIPSELCKKYKQSLSYTDFVRGHIESRVRNAREPELFFPYLPFISCKEAFDLFLASPVNNDEWFKTNSPHIPDYENLFPLITNVGNLSKILFPIFRAKDERYYPGIFNHLEQEPWKAKLMQFDEKTIQHINEWLKKQNLSLYRKCIRIFENKSPEADPYADLEISKEEFLRFFKLTPFNNSKYHSYVKLNQDVKNDLLKNIRISSPKELGAKLLNIPPTQLTIALLDENSRANIKLSFSQKHVFFANDMIKAIKQAAQEIKDLNKQDQLIPKNTIEAIDQLLNEIQVGFQ